MFFGLFEFLFTFSSIKRFNLSKRSLLRSSIADIPRQEQPDGPASNKKLSYFRYLANQGLNCNPYCMCNNKTYQYMEIQLCHF